MSYTGGMRLVLSLATATAALMLGLPGAGVGGAFAASGAPAADPPRAGHSTCGSPPGSSETRACGATVRSGSSGSSSAQIMVNAIRGTHHR